ncbi:hypothetical protein LDENG_00238220 [Lucifuga dentata]|nr:hypothetical protein LDENG_00238220 [Lucifuga dentata]
MYADFWCAMYSREPEDVEYLIDWYFNDEYMMQYNSTVGKWTGFTPAGLITASKFNADRHDLFQRKMERELICVNNVGLIFNVTEDNMAEPAVSLQVAKTTSSQYDTMLVCSAYDFYPKAISMTWYRNGQEVKSGMTFSEVTSNGDWTYHFHSYLEYTPKWMDRISCVVEHASFMEPKTYEWDSIQSERNYLVAGAFALLLGAAFLSVGLIQWRRKHAGQMLVPTSSPLSDSRMDTLASEAGEFSN